MGAQGDAKVIAIDPCPPIKPGKGNVITGTFHHEAGQTIDIHVQGLDKPIGCTANHPFWSQTRQDFVEAGTLQPQEDLLLYDGQITKVIQILPRPGPERVHNLEVLNEHVYYVENVGVLVHNAYPSIKKLTIDIDHITSGHVAGGARVSANSLKTLFPENWSKSDVEHAIKDVYSNAKKMQTQGERIRVRGKTKDGLVIELWGNTKTKTIETAYPINKTLYVE